MIIIIKFKKNFFFKERQVCLKSAHRYYLIAGLKHKVLKL